MMDRNPVQVICNGRLYTFRNAKVMAETFKVPPDCLEAYLSIGSESMQKFDDIKVVLTSADSPPRPWWKLW